ncbi:MAG: hypothetical protein KAT34_15580 [Candidatus Aminicenantes bacterium]|nr:hypothetical protein [Candidatus Aminicenantes bacterium]
MSAKYYVMLMDVIGSSDLPNRDEVTEKLEKAMASVNATCKDDFLAPFEITRGDEVAAVLTSIANTYDIITIFRETLFPVGMRTTLIYDELISGLGSRQSSIIDGPAFHRGNSQMLNLKKTQKTFGLNTGQPELDQGAAALLNLLLWQWNNFTPLQQNIIRLYQEIKHQGKVAKIIRRTQQQVQFTLEKCRWELIDEAEKTIRRMLLNIDKKAKIEGL